MKNLIYLIILIVLIGFVPVVSYEREVQNGTTVIEQQSIAEFVYERYQQVQSKKTTVEVEKK